MRSKPIFSIFFISVCLSLIVFFVNSSCAKSGDKGEAPKKEAINARVEARKGGQKEAKNPVVLMKTSKGDITIELFQKDAPITVKNFLGYVNAKFYENTIFHRVIKGFMAQGGRSSNPPPAVKAEFSKQKHIEGTVAMARLPNDVNSATSQFFICFERQPHLDGDYTVFGQVVKGMDVVHTIVQNDVMKKVTIIDKATIEK